MKIAMESYPLTKYFDEATGYKLVKQAGFDGVDLSQFYGVVDLLNENYREKAKETRRLLDEAGLICVQSHAPFYLKEKPEFPGFRYGMNMDLSEPGFLALVRSMEYAAIAGAPQIVVHGIQVPSGSRTSESWDYNYKFYKALAPYAKKFGIKIAVENLGRECFPTPVMHSEMLRRLDDPETFCACFDMGHSFLCFVRPQDFLRDMPRGMVQALHVHDNFGTQDNHLLPGHGKLKWEEITKALAEIGYDGYFTLEVPGYWPAFTAEEMPDAIALAAKVARKLADKVEAYRDA